MQVMVLRPFSGERSYRRGEVVDASKWRTLHHLIQTKYVAPLLPQQEQPAAPRRNTEPRR